MAKCFMKGCNIGATKKLVLTDGKGNTKNRPICDYCAAHQINDPDAPLQGTIIEAASKHH